MDKWKIIFFALVVLLLVELLIFQYKIIPNNRRVLITNGISLSPDEFSQMKEIFPDGFKVCKMSDGYCISFKKIGDSDGE